MRILLDVLNATTQLVQTQRDLKRARYDFLLAGLRLKAAVGTLTDEDIVAVNSLMEAPVPLTGPNVVPQDREPLVRPAPLAPVRPPAATK